MVPHAFTYSIWLIIKRDDLSEIISFYGKLRIALYFAGTKATSANINAFCFAVYDGTYSLDIRFPRSFRFQVGMADVHTAHGTLAANFTIICHDAHTSLQCHSTTYK